MRYPRKDYELQNYLCEKTVEHIQEENIEKASVLEAYLGPCQLPMAKLFAKMVRVF